MSENTRFHIREIEFQDTWPIRHTAMWPDRDIDYVKLPADVEGLHYGLFIEKRLVAVVSLFVNGETAQFRKFATLPEYKGRGLGSELLRHLFQEAKSSGVKRLWCNARVDKAGFYQRFGMEETNQRFTNGGIEYVIMESHIN